MANNVIKNEGPFQVAQSKRGHNISMKSERYFLECKGSQAIMCQIFQVPSLRPQINTLEHLAPINCAQCFWKKYLTKALFIWSKKYSKNCNIVKYKNNLDILKCNLFLWW